MLLLFGLTVFISSLLLFLVEPMIARMALPLLGSTPSVWNTSMLFFQAILLAGYAYAHVAIRWLGARRHALLHIGLLLLALPLLPIKIPAGWTPPAQGNPAWWLLAVLVVSVGLPFFLLSSTAPMLQGWLAATTHRAARDPYVLYRASNLGSAVALLAYPILVEPTLRLDEQARFWQLAYVSLVVVTLAAVGVLLRTTRTSDRLASGEVMDADAASRPIIAGGAIDVSGVSAAIPAPSSGGIDVTRKLRWMLLAFAPSSLMLAVTTYATSDIAPIPLLWILPLTLYLLSFVLVFSPRARILHGWTTRVFPFAVLSIAISLGAKVVDPLWVLVPLHLLAFFVVAMKCHGEVARDRPDPSRLTEFYLWIALGGVLGGLFNAIVAPRVFNSFTEYPTVLVLACLVTAGPILSNRGQRRLDVMFAAGVAVATAAVLVGALDVAHISHPIARATMLVIPAALCVTFARRPLRFGLAVGAMLVVAAVLVSQPGRLLFADRTFFGTHRVVVEGRFHLLMHGNTLHGAQATDPSARDEPLTYYSRTGPVGQLFRAFDDAHPGTDVAVVGLGAGSMACYAKPGERWTFYEIDPAILRIATDARFFTYLRDCLPGRYIVALGDARLSLRTAHPGRFGLLAIDAFNSDAIPVHLMTREAMRLYLRTLTPHGVLAFHITNRYLDLVPVVANLARDAGLVGFIRADRNVPASQLAGGKLPSTWVAMARSTDDLRIISSDPRWKRLQANPNDPVWTDDFSNILSTLRLS
jgi:hypothetical protein